MIDVIVFIIRLVKKSKCRVLSVTYRITIQYLLNRSELNSMKTSSNLTKPMIIVMRVLSTRIVIIS